MDEDWSRSNSNSELKSKFGLINQGRQLMKARSDVWKVLEDKAVDPVVIKGIRLAQDVVMHLLGEEVCLLHQDRVSLCLKNSVVEMLDKHAVLFTSFAKRLSRTPENTSEAFVGVSEELFQHGRVTWSRIIALYALAGRLALYYEENNMHRLARSIPQCMERCIAGRIASFVNKNGGWVRAKCYCKLPA
jgi:hypothetical protein